MSFWRRGTEIELLFCSSTHGNRVAMEVHDPIRSGVVHLPIVEELVALQDTVPLLPGANVVPLLVEEAIRLTL